ncbi:MAG: hypothetical protein WCH37_09460, partial [Synechococcaceae cyanobacterium ELA182]
MSSIGLSTFACLVAGIRSLGPGRAIAVSLPAVLSHWNGVPGGGTGSVREFLVVPGWQPSAVELLP